MQHTHEEAPLPFKALTVAAQEKAMQAFVSWWQEHEAFDALGVMFQDRLSQWFGPGGDREVLWSLQPAAAAFDGPLRMQDVKEVMLRALENQDGPETALMCSLRGMLFHFGTQGVLHVQGDASNGSGFAVNLEGHSDRQKRAVERFLRLLNAQLTEELQEEVAFRTGETQVRQGLQENGWLFSPQGEVLKVP